MTGSAFVGSLRPSALGQVQGPWDHPGARRIVTLDDGGTAREEITALEPPDRFAYALGELSPPFSRLVRGARAEWRLTRSRGHVRGLALHVGHGVAAATGRLAVSRVYYRRYMQRALQIT